MRSSLNLLSVVKEEIRSDNDQVRLAGPPAHGRPPHELYVDSWSSSGQKAQPHSSRPLCRWSWFAFIRQGMITGTPGLAPSKAAALKISPRFRCVSAVDIFRSLH